MKQSFSYRGSERLPLLQAKDCALPHGFFGKPVPHLFPGDIQKKHEGPFFSPSSVAPYYQESIAVACPAVTITGVAHVSQIHSSHVITLDRATHSGPLPHGRLHHDAADGLVTNIPGVVLSIATADCLPGLLYSHDGSVVGAFHAGWKGACKGVALQTLAALRALQKNDSMPVHALIGPCIRKESFEVQDEFIQQLSDYQIDPSCYISRLCDDDGHSERRFFDLPALVRDQLLSAGIASDHINDCEHDSYPPASGYFSFRRITHEKKRYICHNYGWISPLTS